MAARVSTPRGGRKDIGLAEAFGFDPEAEGVLETTDALLFSGEPLGYITDRAVGAMRDKLDSWQLTGRWQRCVRFDVGDQDEKPEPKRNRSRANACDDLETLVAAYEAKCLPVEEAPHVESDLALEDCDASESGLVGDASESAEVVSAEVLPVGRDLAEAMGEQADDVMMEKANTASDEGAKVSQGRAGRRVHFDESTIKEEVAPFVGRRPRAATVFDLDAWFAGESA